MNPFRRKTRRTPLASERLPDIPFDALPPQIATTLRKAASRIRRIVVTRGVLAVAATVLVAILCSMAVDAMVALVSPAVRWAMWATGLGAAALVARATLVRPLSKKLTPARLAALIERNHPELEERLSTVVELMASPESLAEGSEELLKVVTDAAVHDAGGISPTREFTARTVRPRLAAACGAAAVLALLFAIWPHSTGRLFARAVAPAARIDNVYADSLRVVPGDATVLEGRPFAIELAVLGGFPGTAYVRARPADGSSRETSERMVQSSAEREDGVSVRRYRHAIGSVERSMIYRVVCGSAVTRPYSVTVVPEPSFTNLLLELEYPEYTGAAPRLQGDDEPDVSAVAGTEISLSVRPNRELHGALSIPGAEIPAETDPGTGLLKWSFSLTNGMAGVWSVALWDDNGFSNAPSAHVLQVVPDAEPAFSFASPTNLSMQLPTHGRIPAAYAVEEDFGLLPLVLEASVDSGPWREVRTAPLAETPLEGLWAGNDEIRLSSLDLDGKTNVRFRYKAVDNFPESLGGPHVAHSPAISVRLDSAARSLGLQRLDSDKKSADRKLEEVKKTLDSALSAAREALAKAEAKDDKAALEKTATAKERIAKAEDAARALSKDLEHGALAALEPEAEALLHGRIEPAHEAADEAAAANEEDRPEALRRVVDRLEEARKAADEMGESVAKTHEEMKKARDIEDLADRQDELAEKASREMSDSRRESWMKKQEELEELMKRKAGEISEKRPLSEEAEKAAKLANEFSELSELQEKLSKLRDQLAAENRQDRQAASDELRDLAPKLPDSATPEDRLRAAQQDVADQARAMREEIAALQAKLDAMNTDGDQTDNHLSDAERNAQSAQDAAQEIADAFQSNPDWDGNRDPNAELPEADGDPNAKRDWDGNRDENAETRQADGDPNAKRDWDGKRDQNAETRQADGDPNAKRNWDGKRDENAENRQADGDPNAKNRPPWDGKIDPNAMMDAAQQMRNASEALRRAEDSIKQQGSRMQEQNAAKAQEALNAMAEAQKAMQQGQQQQGQQQDGQQQQGQQQQGQQQDGQQQQGQQQQGQQQDGQQQQGQQQQGQNQNSKNNQGENPAADAAQQAADAMRDLAQQMGEQSGANKNRDNDSKNQQNGESRGGKDSEPGGKHSNEDTGEAGIPELLEALGLGDLDWFKTKGSTKGERLDSALDDVPAEYRGLVREYFDALRAQGK